jgi:hypothetical protein
MNEVKEIENKIGQLQYEISCLGLDKEDLTGVNIRTEELKELVKNLTTPDVSVSVAEVRQAFADYYKSEGCTCCQDTETHDKAEEKLAELLQPDQYDDESGFNWYKYATEY